MDKNPPANSGDKDSIPGPGRFHMPVEQINPWATTIEPMCFNYWSPNALEPVLHNKRSHCNEEPMWPQLESNPHSLQLEKSPHTAMNTQYNQK